MSISSFNHALQRAFRAPSTCTAQRSSSSSCTTTQLLLLDRSTSNHISADEQKQCTYHHIASRHVTSAHQSRAQAFISSHSLTHAPAHISHHMIMNTKLTLPLTPCIALKRAHTILLSCPNADSRSWCDNQPPPMAVRGDEVALNFEQLKTPRSEEEWTPLVGTAAFSSSVPWDGGCRVSDNKWMYGATRE
jgi:hypothetical protein